jgi:hypothetical protein
VALRRESVLHQNSSIKMSYHRGIHIGTIYTSTFVKCDSCSHKYIIPDGYMPPVWFIDGKAPPKWRIVRRDEKRYDYCPTCKKDINEKTKRR